MVYLNLHKAAFPSVDLTDMCMCINRNGAELGCELPKN